MPSRRSPQMWIPTLVPLLGFFYRPVLVLVSFWDLRTSWLNLFSNLLQSSSIKHQASSIKHQASSICHHINSHCSNYLGNTWARDPIKFHNLVSGELKKTHNLDEFYTWARDVVMWHCLVWQLSINQEMIPQYYLNKSVNVKIFSFVLIIWEILEPAIQ